MSNQQIPDAKLKGFEGPYYPDEITRERAQGLRRVQKRLGYHPERINVMLFHAVARELGASEISEKKDVQMYVLTSDEYMWTGRIEFAHEGKRYVVLIPMLHDSAKGDGTYADRSVALYSMASSSYEQQLAAMTAFATAFVKAYKAMYGNSIKVSKQANGVPLSLAKPS